MNKEECHIYTIRQGDSIYRIHKSVNSPFPLLPDFIRELKKANSWKVLPLIHVGDVIRIPKFLCGDRYNLMIENAWR